MLRLIDRYAFMDGVDSVKRIMSISHIRQEHKCRLELCSEQSEQAHGCRAGPETVAYDAEHPNA